MVGIDIYVLGPVTPVLEDNKWSKTHSDGRENTRFMSAAFFSVSLGIEAVKLLVSYAVQYLGQICNVTGLDSGISVRRSGLLRSIGQ